MAAGGKKARDADRDQAIDLVEGAWVEGQITAADRDLRVERLLAADTVWQAHRLVTDLQSPRDQTPPDKTTLDKPSRDKIRRPTRSTSKLALRPATFETSTGEGSRSPP